jgi:hypothetical protein
LSLLARDRHAANFAPLLLRSGGVARHVTITSNDGHCIVCLVACGTTPHYRSSRGVQDHASVVWVPAGSFNIVADTRRIKRKIDIPHLTFDYILGGFHLNFDYISGVAIN